MQPYYRRHSPQLVLLMLGATSDSLHVKRVRFPKFTSHKLQVHAEVWRIAKAQLQIAITADAEACVCSARFD
jgi:hypothetical protein